MLFGKTSGVPTVLPRRARLIASWNSGRDVWETDQVDLLSGRSVVYSETFTISGLMRNGVVYELPTSAHHMDGSGFSSLPPDGDLFPTPAASVANDGESTESWLARRERVKLTAANGNGMGMPLTIAVQLLPTPQARDGKGVPGDGFNEASLPRAVAHLLPTPKAGDADFGMPRTSGRPPEKSTHLATRVEHTKPADSWGSYAAAIERWEAVTGRQAPEPTEAGPNGGRRLAARFVEWMMGLPAGWVTDPRLGLSRVQQLRALGNGVLPRQALAALRLMGGDG